MNFNKKNYFKIVKYLNHILLSNSINNFKYNIPFLFLNREHPVFFSRYISKENHRLKFFLRNLYHVFYKLYCSLFLRNIKSDFYNLPKKVDFLFVSHLTNVNQIKNLDDQYFGNIINDLVDKNFKCLVIYINHTNYRKQYLINKTKSLNKFIIPKNANFLSEIQFLFNSYKGYTNLKVLKVNNNEILKQLKYEIFSIDTIGVLRFKFFYNKILNKINPSFVVSTFEGHAYERQIFHNSKLFNPRIINFAYQHSIISKYVNTLSLKLNDNSYNPDVILCSGKSSFNFFKNFSNFKNLPVYVLGSKNYSDSDPKEFDNSIKRNSCLILPEGIYSECLIFLEFAVSCAKLNTSISFIFRLHPIIDLKKLKILYKKNYTYPSNLIFSKSSFNEDINISSWALYRGSSAVYKAIEHGLIPIYLSAENELEIDPLYDLKIGKKVVKNSSELKTIIDKDISCNFRNNISFQLSYKSYIKNIFSKPNSSVIINEIKNHKF